MKKRVKLLTTIASLCLAVALMAFGVYAATSVSFKATGTISFTSTEISGTWTLAVAAVNGTPAEQTPTVTPAAEDNGVGSATVANTTVTDITQECTITLTATFVNTSTTDATLSVTSVVPTTQTGYTLVASTPNNVPCPRGETKQIVITFTISDIDPTQEGTGIEYSATFAANK